eukprot:2165267-Prymnesium_polylepis.2
MVDDMVAVCECVSGSNAQRVRRQPPATGDAAMRLGDAKKIENEDGELPRVAVYHGTAATCKVLTHMER